MRWNSITNPAAEQLSRKGATVNMSPVPYDGYQVLGFSKSYTATFLDDEVLQVILKHIAVVLKNTHL